LRLLFQARILARQYKQLNEKETRKWEKKAEQDKLRYQEEMKHYIPMEDPTGGGRKKAKKDPNAPKRNMSAYFLYSIEARPQVKADNPDASFGDSKYNLLLNILPLIPFWRIPLRLSYISLSSFLTL